VFDEIRGLVENARDRLRHYGDPEHTTTPDMLRESIEDLAAAIEILTSKVEKGEKEWDQKKSDLV
jgi:hypothetical protein